IALVLDEEARELPADETDSKREGDRTECDAAAAAHERTLQKLHAPRSHPKRFRAARARERSQDATVDHQAEGEGYESSGETLDGSVPRSPRSSLSELGRINRGPRPRGRGPRPRGRGPRPRGRGPRPRGRTCC